MTTPISQETFNQYIELRFDVEARALFIAKLCFPHIAHCAVTFEFEQEVVEVKWHDWRASDFGRERFPIEYLSDPEIEAKIKKEQEEKRRQEDVRRTNAAVAEAERQLHWAKEQRAKLGQQ